MNVDRAAVRMVAVFPEVNALPGSESEAGILERDREIDAGEGGADVGGHVIGSFGGVDKEAVAVRNDFGHECFEIAANVGVGVFLDEK
jgi:hypothetical protein